ncbi:CDP-alcohol phosphatidyltransferase family protein [Amnibacterium setariae]|uniref:CDP-alcohol phosphatidyltransferase family protein n=1 Tax=Amnibacterium setariae TaxID=2306585 RepID=A0A3A1TTC6_9MICO|nr:CDP-alcohol phosphatidyltransferase family protein [Amnibacterium setariae]RIX26613.1 CDP-alcohol phosphatidyltransferase family protein [Amnibacterium setariae]
MLTEPAVDVRRPVAPVPETYRQTVARLQAAQKPVGRGAPAYSVHVNRRLGRFIAAAAFRFGLTPNQVTALSAALTFAAILLLALVPPTFWLGLAVTVLLAAGYAFDSADGQVARLRGGGSAAGEWLDHVIDAVKTSALHGAVLLLAYRFLVPADQRAWLLVPIGFMIVAAVSFAVFLLNDLLRAARARTTTATAIRTGSTPLRSLLGLPTDYGLLIYVFLLLGAPGAFVIAYTLLLAAHTGYLVLALPKWFRDMKAIEPAAS